MGDFSWDGGGELNDDLSVDVGIVLFEQRFGPDLLGPFGGGLQQVAEGAGPETATASK